MGRRSEVLQLWNVQAYGPTLQKSKRGKRKNARDVKRSKRLVSSWSVMGIGKGNLEYV